MRTAGTLLALGLAALVVALLGGALWPRNSGWVEAADGVTIWLDTSPVHAELVLPVEAAGHDWRKMLAPGAIGPASEAEAGGSGAVTHLGFSWGDRDFFRATPTWADLDPVLAFRALFASEASLVHLYRLPGPSGSPIRLSEAEYARLVSWLQREIAPGDPQPGYGAADVFLPGTSRYSWQRTCNNWVADGLAAAGVTVGLWTPMPQGLAWRFDDGTVDPAMSGSGSKRES